MDSYEKPVAGDGYFGHRTAFYSEDGFFDIASEPMNKK